MLSGDMPSSSSLLMRAHKDIDVSKTKGPRNVEKNRSRNQKQPCKLDSQQTNEVELVE
jgi:hypothetical protein